MPQAKIRQEEKLLFGRERRDNLVVQWGHAHSYFKQHFVKELVGPHVAVILSFIFLLPSVSILNGCGENHHSSLTDQSEAHTIPQTLSGTKVFIKPGSSDKMKDGHLLNQHTVSGAREDRERWGGVKERTDN